MMKILLTGASGFIGGHIARALHQQGHEFIAVSRCSGYDFNKMLHVQDWLPLLEGIDCVINAAGIIQQSRLQPFSHVHFYAAEALFSACEQLSLKRVIQISALGADEKAFSAFHLSKKAADDRLKRSHLDWFILRPSLVCGEGGRSNRMFQKLASLRLIPLVAGGQQLIQPVHIDDLVDTVLHCIKTTDTRQTLNVVGPAAISLIDWLQSIRRQQGRSPVRTITIPYSLAMSFARFAQYVSPLIQPDTLKMLQQGNVADVTPLVEFLGHMPRSVEQ